MKDVQEAADAAFAGVNASRKAIEFARKKGIDLSQVAGTGEDGRITKADILRAMNPAAEAPAAAAPAQAADTVIPMEGVRKLIADNMQASLTNAAQLTVFLEIDVTGMVELRGKLLARNKRNPDYRLSYNDIVSYAVCRALKRHPIMNSTLQDDGIHLHDYVNLGIAVSIDNGLIVPNVKNADKYGLEGLRTEVRDVATRARKGGPEHGRDLRRHLHHQQRQHARRGRVHPRSSIRRKPASSAWAALSRNPRSRTERSASGR